MTIIRNTAELISKQIMGFGEPRTAWTIYNIHATATIYWNNQRMGSTASGFPIPAGGSWSLKIPEDDPKDEVHIISDTAAAGIAIYEGYGEKQ